MNDIISDTAKVEKVKSEHEKGLVECLQKIRQWEKFKADYEKLKGRLSTLPDKLSYDVVISFGKQAFVPGFIVNTNNVTVLLGDNWFVEVSAKQAGGIAERRIKQCEETLNNLQKEKKQLEDWLGFIADVTDKNLVDIKEEYDPEKEELWREQHTERLRDHRRKVAEEKKAELSVKKKQKDIVEENEDQFKSDEYYLNRLNELEREEEGGGNSSETDEDTSLETEEELESSKTHCPSKNEDINLKRSSPTLDDTIKDKKPDTKERTMLKVVDALQSSKDDNTMQGVIFNTDIISGNVLEDFQNISICEEKMMECQNNKDASAREENNLNNNIDSNGDQDKHGHGDKHVRWIDLSEAKSKKITFTHSKPIPVKHNRRNRRRRNSSNSEPDDESMDDKTPPSINSPSDIYKCFSYSIQNSKPKSILKAMHSSSTESIMSSGEYSDSAQNDEISISPTNKKSVSQSNQNDAPSQKSENIEKAFTGEVQENFERKAVSKTTRSNDSRPKSLFKASRQGAKR